MRSETPEPNSPIAPSPAPAAQRDGVLQRTVGFVVLAGGAAAVITAVVVGQVGVAARDRFETSNRVDADARDQAIGLRTGANIAWATAGTLGITGGILVLTGRSKTGALARRTEIRLGLGAVGGSF